MGRGTIFQSTPTEYKGVRYKSKCEAMFALYLDLQRDETLAHPRIAQTGFEYEPDGYSIDGYQVDFMVWDCYKPSAWWRNLELQRPMIAFIGYDFIEYKPRKPSKTYIENAGLRWKKIEQKITNLGFGEIIPYSNFLIYYGSTYLDESENGLVSFVCDEPIVEEDDWLVNYREAISNYRFDLEESR